MPQIMLVIKAWLYYNMYQQLLRHLTHVNAKNFTLSIFRVAWVHNLALNFVQVYY